MQHFIEFFAILKIMHLLVTALNGFVQNASPIIVQHVVEFKDLNPLNCRLAITNVCLGTVYEVDGWCI